MIPDSSPPWGSQKRALAELLTAPHILAAMLPACLVRRFLHSESVAATTGLALFLPVKTVPCECVCRLHSSRPLSGGSPSAESKFSKLTLKTNFLELERCLSR